MIQKYDNIFCGTKMGDKKNFSSFFFYENFSMMTFFVMKTLCLRKKKIGKTKITMKNLAFDTTQKPKL